MYESISVDLNRGVGIAGLEGRKAEKELLVTMAYQVAMS
jgi:hypothetical protein